MTDLADRPPSSIARPAVTARAVPSRAAAALFAVKAAALRARRSWHDALDGMRPRRHPAAVVLNNAPVVATARSPLWTTDGDPREWALTAGKVQNLRVALRRLDGVVVPAGQTFSFWRQIGRATHRRGFVVGRELREGCMIGTVGGGLCQLSNALYGAALDAGFEIVERHAHSRVVPGSRAGLGRDATVFWNYVDLRFRSPHAFRIEVRMDSRELEVRFRATSAVPPRDTPARPAAAGDVHDCVTCGQVSCFRHTPPPVAAGSWPTVWLIDSCWPEYAALFTAQAGPRDALFLPLRSALARRYAWPLAPGPEVRATVLALARAVAQRCQPAQGGALQTLALAYDRRLAAHYADRLPYTHTHLVIGQSLLPHLWQRGCLQGRTFDVLMERWPLADLQARLDRAHQMYPDSPTLGDFRAPADLVAAEAAALAAAGRLYTPHHALAGSLAGRAVLVPWAVPAVARPGPAVGGRTLLLPVSPVGRKGIYGLRDALHGLDVDLVVAGRAREHDTRDLRDFWGDIPVRALDGAAWPARLAAVVLPAVIEHQPRALLRAQALGIPVVASVACGLPHAPGITLVRDDDVTALRDAIVAHLHDPSASDAMPRQI
jgi:hypothetical protein